MKEMEKTVDLLKKAFVGSIKYIKVSYTPTSSTYHVKIYLLKPLEWKTFSELVKELEKNYSIKIYAPHARAIRLDLKKKS